MSEHSKDGRNGKNSPNGKFQHSDTGCRLALAAMLLSLMLVLSGCSAVANYAEGTDRSSPSPTPTDLPYSTQSGFGQPDESISTPRPLQNKTPRSDINVSLVEESLVTELNTYRTRKNLGQLVSDPRLAIIARNHSHDMAKQGFFSHTNPDGLTSEDRARRNSYNCGISAENIHHDGWKTGNLSTEDELAEETIGAFIQSPPHNQAMLIIDLTTVGIGIYVTSDRHVYVTMMLCGS
ncbi:CAP domain-containing protein [Halorarum halobium]|uniref:CAP domain-containing protein n=1 Tax=Halorarum halobium TaxID=3075121 RepID=UPI0028AFF09F|nr:CAP domain-containing protein [Halobaculum sp. XH14]